MFLNGLGLRAELPRILATPVIAHNLESGALTEETRHCEAWPLACRNAKGASRGDSWPTARTRGFKEKAPPRTGPGSPLQHQIGVRKELPPVIVAGMTEQPGAATVVAAQRRLTRSRPKKRATKRLSAWCVADHGPADCLVPGMSESYRCRRLQTAH